MADFKFTCPHCNQPIVCDELWSGHQIQCPSCQVELTVPQKQPEPAAKPLVPRPPASAPKLSIGRSSSHSAAPAAATAARGSGTTPRPMVRMQAKKSSGGGALKYAKIAAIIVVLGVGGYFGFVALEKYQEKTNDKRRESEKQSDGGEVGHIANLNNVLDQTDPNRGGGSGRSSSGGNPSRI